MVDDACFLCGDSRPPLLRVCHCDTRVHTACFLRLLRVPSHSEQCPVCQHRYRLRHRTVLSIDVYRVSTWCAALLAWLFLTVTCAVVVRIDPTTRLAYAILLFLLLSSAMCASAYSFRTPDHPRCIALVPRVVGVHEAPARSAV